MPMRLFSTSQVARILGAGDRDVEDWMAKGWLPFQRLPDGEIRISEQAVVQFLRDRGVDLPEIVAKVEAREAAGEGLYEVEPAVRTADVQAAGTAPEHRPAQTVSPGVDETGPGEPAEPEPPAEAPAQAEDQPLFATVAEAPSAQARAAEAPPEAPPAEGQAPAEPPELPARGPAAAEAPTLPPAPVAEAPARGEAEEETQAPLAAEAEPEPAVPPQPQAEAEAEAEPQPVSAQARQIAEAILDCAVDDHATDVYLQPSGEGLHLRMRIDGAVREKEAFRRRLPADVAPELLACFRWLAGEADAEAAVLTGRVERTIRDRRMRLDISFWPALHGPAAAIHLRTASPRGTALGELGLSADDEERLRAALAEASGLLLAAGPTRRDTSRTLRAMLLELAAPQRHVVTIERSVDVEIDQVVHAPVDRARGFGFAQAAALLAAQNADVILVESLRDPATALAALDAAEEGAVVLAGMQASSAPAAVEMLLEMGCEPWPLAAALRACVAQTTVRELCPHCKQVEEVGDEVLAGLGLSREEVNFPTYAPRGCEKCSGSGYAGTLALFSVMHVDTGVRRAIRRGADAAALRQAARAAGMKTLLEAGLEQARLGRASLD